MNIKLSYLYRDAGNFKNFGEVVFSNAGSLPLEEIEKTIREKLIDGQWFVAKDWGLPELFFRDLGYDPELDHEWHEFSGLEETNAPANTVEFEEWLRCIKS